LTIAAAIWQRTR